MSIEDRVELLNGPNDGELTDAMKYVGQGFTVRFTRSDSAIRFRVRGLSVLKASDRTWRFCGNIVVNDRDGELVRGCFNTRTRKGWYEPGGWDFSPE